MKGRWNRVLGQTQPELIWFVRQPEPLALDVSISRTPGPGHDAALHASAGGARRGDPVLETGTDTSRAAVEK